MTTQSPVLSAYGVRKRSVRSRFLFRRLSSHVVAVVAVVGVVAAVVVVAFVSAVDKKKSGDHVRGETISRKIARKNLV